MTVQVEHLHGSVAQDTWLHGCHGSTQQPPQQAGTKIPIEMCRFLLWDSGLVKASRREVCLPPHCSFNEIPWDVCSRGGEGGADSGVWGQDGLVGTWHSYPPILLPFLCLLPGVNNPDHSSHPAAEADMSTSPLC